MNGEQAKRCRRAAENESVGMPYRAYDRDLYVELGSVRLHRICTRSRIQKKKKEYKRFGTPPYRAEVANDVT